MLRKSVTIFSLTHLLFLLLDLESAQVLLKLTLVDTMLVLRVLELDLRLLLDHRLLVQVLEHQMLQTLPPNLNRDRILLLQVLMLSILVTELGLFVLKLFLSDEPEVVDSETFVIVLSGGDFLFLDGFLKGTTLVPHRLLVLLVVVVINSVSTGHGLLLRIELLISSGSLVLLGWRHL